jgi:predicted flap endonuclease-1-like 5' DNA nuclease
MDMMGDWRAVFDAWWPLAAIAVGGLALGWALRGSGARDAAPPPPAAPDPAPDPAPDTSAAAQPAFVARDRAASPAVDAAAWPASPPTALRVPPSLDELLADGGRREARVEGQPFATFEAKLEEWRRLARESAESAARAAAAGKVDDGSIDAWDDLMDIDGIGLDLARFLYGQGIDTFEQIAAMSAAQLRAVLDLAGDEHRDVDPAGWPAAARRAIGQR